MKSYCATYWRDNYHLKNGGFYTKFYFEAKSKRQALKIAKDIEEQGPCGITKLESLKKLKKGVKI